ncbi:hypothetical protein SAMN05421803_101620 [Nocardiopsis flavescens]|uniref:Uncharacterized protein n=1 Tax=Nocardiopsis flavescens TaxID=758803 RepID=A0A1M6C8E2_9ACTN|nr:hypothetical protein [Nocardiopsis flavescens]SHI57285.1 hypothetical protein SAMN05421803_101620 [Nocardiopsis flavescens]
MRTAVKFAITGLFAAGLIGAGAGVAGAAPAAPAGGSSYQACIDEQNALGLINLDLNLLSQCIANYNDVN